jgi:hypothetical protein
LVVSPAAAVGELGGTRECRCVAPVLCVFSRAVVSGCGVTVVVCCTLACCIDGNNVPHTAILACGQCCSARFAGGGSYRVVPCIVAFTDLGSC